MKAIISTTYSDTYLYFLPLVTWCWNKLGVDVICFMPYQNKGNVFMHVSRILVQISKLNNNTIYNFDCPENKESTYAQCSRLYAACLDLPENEILVTSDVDMATFSIPPHNESGFTIFGYDLVPQEQYPMCYISASVKKWREAFDLNGKTYQECLDETIGKEECENMRGNLWARDQETAYKKINLTQEITYVPRARPKTQFATHRVDRDDSFWRDRVSNQLVDAHLWRPGYEAQNFANILELMKMMYPYEDFTWLINYTEEYKKLL